MYHIQEKPPEKPWAGQHEWVRTAASGLAIIGVLASLVGGWHITQHRMDLHEKALQELRSEAKEDRKLANDRNELMIQLRNDVRVIHTLMEDQKATLQQMINGGLPERDKSGKSRQPPP